MAKRGQARTENPNILTISEAAAYLHIHRVTLYRLVKRRDFPAFKVGFDWRFSKAALDEWIRHQSEAARQPEEKN